MTRGEDGDELVFGAMLRDARGARFSSRFLAEQCWYKLRVEIYGKHGPSTDPFNLRAKK